MEAVSVSMVIVLHNGLTWQHFPSADRTVAGKGVVLRTKASYYEKLATPFPWARRGASC